MKQSEGDVIEIRQLPQAMLWRFVLSMAMSAGGLYMAFYEKPVFSVDLATIVGLTTVAIFLIAGASLLWRLLTLRGAVITINNRGIRDARVASEFIPWTAIRSVSIWGSQSILVFNVDPAVEPKLGLTPVSKATRGVNKLLGADGLCITSQGLEIESGALLAIVRSRVPPLANERPADARSVG